MTFLFNRSTGKIKRVWPMQELTIPLANTAYDMEESSDDGYTTDVVRRILAAKDSGARKRQGYHELRMALPEDIRDKIPPLSALI